ncbi:hypothetical protein EIN_287870 [Entamoeba invadens IP1]|uniref:Uncharacterized protein n=1 Tax=Entamoeba invadens IP1 TaxID=370355 RepID=A0A0A1U8G3_ENTIV|nr:hypothetical protein EIN_287870 [Entamoeba invadens IP1]ELP89351.1 hypothetical protein EIN_287870 [Entamoeba invadens IP1]|eukprot:XP_004256122.1 hypothetical protein EIN_287870 [Entamoeba invadens IP1]
MFLQILFFTISSALFKEKITPYEVTLPVNLLGGEYTFRTYTQGTFSVRLFPSSDANNNIYIGYTDTNGLGTVIKVKAKTNTILRTDKFTGYSVRGLTVKDDGSYGVFLWNTEAGSIYFSKVDSSGQILFTKNLDLRNLYYPSSVPARGDKGYGIGDSRLNYGNGLFHAYTHTHSDEGHEGDALFTISDDGTVKTIWGWGCSHMTSGLQGWNSQTNTMIHICDSDAYPAFGMFAEADRSNTLYTHIANMGGYSGGELGGVVENGDGWLLIMNSITPEVVHNGVPVYTPNGVQDIGVVSIGKNKKRTNVNFIKQNAQTKNNGCIAKYGEKFLVGYTEDNTKFYLGTIDSSATMKDQFEEVTDVTGWGDRDDSFRSLNSGNIFWVKAPQNDGNKLIIYEFDTATVDPTPEESGEINNGAKLGYLAVFVGMLLMLI